MGTITANKVLSDNGTLLFFVTLYFAILQALAPPTSKMSDNIIFKSLLQVWLWHWPSEFSCGWRLDAGPAQLEDWSHTTCIFKPTKLLELLNFENELFQSCFHGLFYTKSWSYYHSLPFVKSCYFHTWRLFGSHMLKPVVSTCSWNMCQIVGSAESLTSRNDQYRNYEVCPSLSKRILSSHQTASVSEVTGVCCGGNNVNTL